MLPVAVPVVKKSSFGHGPQPLPFFRCCSGCSGGDTDPLFFREAIHRMLQRKQDGETSER